jgi:tetrahedral aminopeptidase
MRISLRNAFFLFLKNNNMRNNLIKNLEKLCKQPGVSEYEKESGISQFLFKMVKNVNPETYIDAAGNIVSIIGNSDKTIILEAHMDEIGFLVDKKNDNIVLSPQGITKDERITNNKIFIVGKNIKGKVSMSPESDFIFTPMNKKDIRNIEEGDIVAFERSFVNNGNEVMASALDNRIGCSVLIEILTMVAKNESKNRLVFVFSRNEETDKSLFGDIINFYKGTFAIVVDAAYAQPVEFNTDAPDVSIPVLGAGCAVQIKGKGFVVSEKDIAGIKNIAKKNNVKIQEERAPQGLGKTNLAKLQTQGIKHGIVINIPVRDQHHQVATANLFDANEAIRLILQIVRE